ncbi:hypothetical protein ACFQFH_05560 [Halobaculum halobium]|uniref:CARDB protein n=1 Tax=Halobaculum halobium TaxID=3032281 RepID=A0ABD5T894_9EURY|nr:hypothetical protein [Halobaculum sp. SYNS20]
MDRRKVLSLVGASSLASLAGCNTIRGAVRSGPPYFEDVEISGPEEANAGEDFELEVSAKNTGGRTGTFSTTLTIGEGAFSIDENVTIEEIPITETKSTTVGPTFIGYTGEYSFRITDYDASHEIEITTVNADLGEQVAIGDLTLSVSNPRLVESFLQEEFDETEVVSPDNGIYVAVDLAVENPDGESDPALRAFELDDEVAQSQALFPDDDSAVTYRDAQPGETGYVVFDVSRDLAGDAFSFYRSLGDSETPEISWSLGELPTPNTSTVGVLTPSSAELDAEYPVIVEFENTGEGDGFYNAILERRIGTEDESGAWEQIATISESVSAESTKEVELSDSANVLTDRKYRVRGPDGASGRDEIDIKPVSRDFGESYAFGDRWEVTVETLYPQFVQSITVGKGYSEETYTADSGQQILLAEVSRENIGGGGTIPDEESFAVVSNSETYDRFDTGYVSTISDPVSGELFDRGYQSEGELMVGWLVFAVSDSVLMDEVQIRCAPTGFSGSAEKAAIWS